MNAVNKNKRFDIKLFRESFRQLKGLALLFAGLILLASLISLLSSPLNDGNTYVSRSVSLLNPMDMQPLLILSFCLAAPFLTLKAFRFTTERKGSDFYHALPQTRGCVFLSLLASVFAWLVLIILVSALVSGLTASLFPDYYLFSWGDLLHLNGSMLLISFYVATVTACAIQLSGTVFSNIIVSLLLLFGPRFVIYNLTEIITGSSHLLTQAYLPFPYGFNLFSHLVYSFSEGGLHGMLYSSGVYDGTRILYTIAAVAAWTLLGVFLAQRRKSEWAEVPVAHRGVRAVIRTGLAFMLCLFPISMFLQNSGNSFDILVCYFLALLLFFGYELLATKSLKSLGKIWPSLLVLAVLNLGAILLCRGTVKIANAYQPEPEEIQYVRLLNDRGSMSQLVGNLQDCKLKDKEVHRLVAELLQKSREIETRYERRSIYGYYGYYGYEVSSRYLRQIVSIKSGLLERYRWLFITQEDMEKLSQALAEDAEYVAAYMNLPEESQLTGTFRMPGSFSQETDVPLLIYRTLREEVQEIGFTRWFQHQNKEYADGSRFLILESSQRGIHSYAEFLIDEDLPKTLALYRAEEEKYNLSQKKLIESQLEAWLESPTAGNIYLQLNDTRHQLYRQAEWRVLSPDTSEEAIKLMKENGVMPITQKQLQLLLEGLSRMNADMDHRSESGVWINLDVYGTIARDASALRDASAVYVADAVPEAIEALLEDLDAPQWGR